MPTQPLSGQLHNRLLAGLSQSEQSRLREDMALVSNEALFDGFAVKRLW